MHVALIVEGDGDVASFPILTARVAATFHRHAFAPRPIRAGGFCRLRRKGELERYVEMAATRPGVELIMIAIDLDDECPKEMQGQFISRAELIASLHGIPVVICFCTPEYEGWFIDDIQTLKRELPNLGWDQHYVCRSPENIRGAKEEIGRAMKRPYKVMQDQPNFSRRVDVRNLYVNSRSFRKFCKCIVGGTYEDLALAMGC